MKNQQRPYRVWFCSNEQYTPLFFEDSAHENGTTFGVAGAGEYAFQQLAAGSPRRVVLADTRSAALDTVRLKIAMYRALDYAEIRSVFGNAPGNRIARLLEKARVLADPPIAQLLETHLSADRSATLIDRLRGQRIWYAESFRFLRQPERYARYLTDEKSYERLRGNLSSVHLFNGDIAHSFAESPDHAIGMIYLSNILDSIRYTSEPTRVLALCRKKIAPHGALHVVTQQSPARLERLLHEADFVIQQVERHPFNLWHALRGSYDYSFVVASSSR